jgi:hypothetical protein
MGRVSWRRCWQFSSVKTILASTGGSTLRGHVDTEAGLLCSSAVVLHEHGQSIAAERTSSSRKFDPWGWKAVGLFS